MVRAVRLETNPSGSYYNASEGVFATVSVPPPPLLISLGISVQSAGFARHWNSVPGTTYEVLSSMMSFSPELDQHQRLHHRQRFDNCLERDCRILERAGLLRSG